MKKRWSHKVSLAIAILFSLSSCAPVTQGLAPHLVEPNIALLNNEQALERLRFLTRGCLKWAGTYPGRLKECMERLERGELKSLGNRVADLNPNWPESVRSVLRAGGPVAVGMTTEQVKMTLGEPSDKNSTYSASRVTSQWVYRKPDLYVYFQNGIVTSFQM